MIERLYGDWAYGDWDRTRIAKRKSKRVRDVSQIEALVRRIHQFAVDEEASAESLVLKTETLRKLVRTQTTSAVRPDSSLATSLQDALSDELLIAAGAIVVQAVKQALGIRLFDVQLHAGIVLSLGGIAQMQTGEGKTLAGVLPAYLHALRGRGVHVTTPNGYLAARDWELLSPVYRVLGLTTGLVQDDCDNESAASAYRADITFGASHTFGFDYLRDQLCQQQEDQKPLGDRLLARLRGQNPILKRQRGLSTAIVDEADDVLLDDAVSPLILSGSVPGEAADAEVHRLATETASKLNIDIEFIRSASGKIEFTRQGLQGVYDDPSMARHPRLQRPWHEYVQTALRAKHCLQRDVHYVVRDDQVQIIDHSTGRVFEDRTWSGGLQQAVEALEGLAIRNEAMALSRITKQRFYRSYEFLAGMTGTATGCSQELALVYGLPIGVVPPRLPARRRTLACAVTQLRSEKRDAVASEAIEIAREGRAVLIGTLSVAESLEIAARLQRRGQTFQLLNGVQDAKEADIISMAGQTGRITVATNLAGRGTDIRLDEVVRANGGLHVIVTQMHSLERVDRQLIGRGARCGDPGSARMYVSAEDDLVVSHAPWIVRAIGRLATDGICETNRFDDALKALQRQQQSLATNGRLRLLQSDQEDQKLFRSGREEPQACQLM